MMISILVKSGTGGYYNEDGCDLEIQSISDNEFPIPRIGETLEILENGRGTYHDYLVTDVRYWINETRYGVTVYAIPIGRSAI